MPLAPRQTDGQTKVLLRLSHRQRTAALLRRARQDRVLHLECESLEPERKSMSRHSEDNLREDVMRLQNENTRLKHRVDELLATTNKYLQEARDARDEAKKWQMNHKVLLDTTWDLVKDRDDAIKRRDNALMRAKEAEEDSTVYKGQITRLLLEITRLRDLLHGGKTRIRHYKGGVYLKLGPIKMQISEPTMPGNCRLIADGDELIGYMLLDGSMTFARFPDEMNDPNRFMGITDEPAAQAPESPEAP
jgi:hypothetical protein